MKNLNISRRWIAVRLLALTAIVGGYTAAPVSAHHICLQCVWDWNGSGYVADCQSSTSGGYNGCIPEDGFCYVGAACA